MLYPDFKDLVALKDQKFDFKHPSYRLAKSSTTGNHHSPFRGQGLEFDSVREYVPGDDIRSIDWRVTARTGAPHLKLFKEERERHIVICVDMNAAMRFGTRNTFKSVQAARVAALLGWQGIDDQDRVSACLFGEVPNGIQCFNPKRTKKSIFAILKMFCEPSPEQHRVLLEDALKHIDRVTQTGSLIYLISDFMDVNQHFQESRLARLSKRCDIVFITVNDQADQSMYPMGQIQFSGGKEKININTESYAGREAYAAQWQENRLKLLKISSRLNIPLIELTTESDLPRDLMLGLKNIVKRKR